ncbi:MAG: MMPL family transporter [bacterium]
MDAVDPDALTLMVFRDPFFKRVLRFLQSTPIRHPWRVIAIATFLAALGGYVTLFRLEIQSDRKQLVNQELKTNRLFEKYSREFGNDEVVVLVISSEKALSSDNVIFGKRRRLRTEMKKIAASWCDELRQRPELFPKVIERVEWRQNGSAALYLPLPDVQHLTDALTEHRADITNLSRSPSLDHIFAFINKNLQDIEVDTSRTKNLQTGFMLNRLERFLQWLRFELQQNTNNGVTKTEDADWDLSFGRYDKDGYIFSEDGALLTIFATIQGNPRDRNRFSEPIQFAELALNKAMSPIPDSLHIEAGLAGMPVLEHDELQTTQKDFARSAVFALILITILFMLGFGNILRPALAALCLALAIEITFLIAWLIIGHLNVLALIFTVILVALGIDFAIHVLTHYERALKESHSPADAIMETYGSIGRPLWIGGLTTGIAFLSAYFTEFVGLSELGIIAGLGLLVCFGCMVWVYPAMLFLLDTHFPGKLALSSLKISDTTFSPAALTRYLLHTPYQKVILYGTLFIIIAGYVWGQYEFDTNLLNLQEADGRAHYWQKILISKGDRSVSAISTYQTRAELDDVRERLEQRPDIVRTTESLYPAHELTKRQLLTSACSTFARLSIQQAGTPSPFKLRREIWNFRQRIRKYRKASPEAENALSGLEKESGALYRLLAQMPPERFELEMAAVQQNIARELDAGLTQIKNLLCPKTPELADIPTVLKDRYLGKDGSIALAIYPAKNSWEKGNLEEFVEEVRQIEPNVIGELISLYENGQSLIKSFLQASIYSLITIVTVLFIWSKSVRTTLLIILPLVTGVGVLLGIMKFIPVHWNFANFFGLPILIGIGVDSGIHLVSAWNRHNLKTFHAASKAVLFSAMTTIIGFGFLATSTHLGVGTLGIILFMGIGLILLASLTLLPIILNDTHTHSTVS